MAQPSPGIKVTDISIEQGTARFYEREAASYAKQTLAANLSELHNRFSRMLPDSARILDVGCGAGRDLKVFRLRGFHVVGLEPSAALAAIAREHSDCEVQVEKVEDMNYAGKFDGVWACASLLHLPKERFPSSLARIHRALKIGGIFFLSMQLGEGDEVAADNRYFARYDSASLNLATSTAGFELLDVWESNDSLGARPIRWINILARAI